MLSGPLPTMHVAKQRQREAEGPDSMILQQIEKMSITEKRKLLKRLKTLITKKMAGSTLTGKLKRYPRCRSVDSFCKGHFAGR